MNAMHTLYDVVTHLQMFHQDGNDDVDEDELGHQNKHNKIHWGNDLADAAVG